MRDTGKYVEAERLCARPRDVSGYIHYFFLGFFGGCVGGDGGAGGGTLGSTGSLVIASVLL